MPRSLADMVVEDAIKVYEDKEERFGAEAMSQLASWVLLRTIDANGAITSTRWITCAKASACARWPSGTPRGVQERGLPAVPGDDGVHPDGLRPLRLPPGDRQGRGAGSRRPRGNSSYSGGGDTAWRRTSRAPLRPPSSPAWPTARPRPTRRLRRPPDGRGAARRSTKWGGTIPVRAAAARSTRSAVEREAVRCAARSAASRFHGSFDCRL